MRVLIADRNARLLEAIARSFAHEFSIQTATSQERCNELLSQGEFALAVISEKLADGRGLQLLGQIARDSPGTLRVLAARPSRLELLEGKLEPFGLFRTLTYPIDPRELQLALTQAGEAAANPAAAASKVLRSSARSAFERLSLTSADTLFATDVLTTIASMESARRTRLPPAWPQSAHVARAYSDESFRAESDQARAPRGGARPDRASASQSQNVAPERRHNARRSRDAEPASQDIASQPAQAQLTQAQLGQAQSGRARSTAAQPTQAQSGQAQPAQARPSHTQSSHAQRAQSQPSHAQSARAQSTHAQASHTQSSHAQRAQAQPSQAQSAVTQHPARQPVASRAAAARSPAPTRSSSQSEAFQRAVARRRAGNRSGGGRVDSRSSQRAPAHGSPMRRKFVLAASIVAVFLVTTLAFNLLDAGVHVTQASAPRPQIEPPVSTPIENPTPAGPSPAFTPAPQVAQRVEPKPAPPPPEMDPTDPQVATTTGPIADPSSFGSEAYEPIYSN